MNRSSALMRTLLLGISSLGVLAMLTASLSCQRVYSGPQESISVAWSPFEQEALLWVAEDQQLFKANGLNVTFRKYDSGSGSLEGLIKGEADVTVGFAEFPMVRKAFQKTDVSVIGTVANVENQYLVGRKDQGIQKVADLKGKRIGTTLGTIAEFYLGRLLELNGLNISDIIVVDLKNPAEWENSIADGTVDAILTAQPYADLASSRLGGNSFVWPAQAGQHFFGLVVSSNDWLARNPEAMRRFLKTLVQAEEYALKHPPEAKAITQKRLGVDASLIDAIWARDQFYVSLDRSLVAAMEDEARWMINNNLTTEKEVPFFNNFINGFPLEAVDPERVNYIR
jgi:ABC-type nitrate/sulfonate/bicarbonate transport system substrate-binding protein